jgi:L-fuconolactonase
LEIIDIHPHVISADTARYPYDPVGGKMSDWAKERPVTCEELLAFMDAAGIGRAAIVHSSTTYGYDNSYAADCVAAHPERLAFVGAVDVRAPDAPERITYWVRERGMAGLRIFAAGSTMDENSGEWLDDPKTFPAWACARDLGISVCVQMRAKEFPRLRTLLDRFPEIKVLIDHFAHAPTADGPPYEQAREFFDLAKRPNVYLKLTERVFTNTTKGNATTESFLRRTVAEFGSDRIAWGSNFPASEGSLQELLDLAVRGIAFLPESDRAAIMSGTARTLYPVLD